MLIDTSRDTIMTCNIVFPITNKTLVKATQRTRDDDLNKLLNINGKPYPC